MNRFPPIDPRHPKLWHGGDYNPDQWLHVPEVIEEDFRLARLAHVNTFTVGVFAWSTLEPEEGRFTFDWLDRILDQMAAQNMAAILSTPSGARPAWMSFKYPEVLRVTRDGRRRRHGGRHNHCPTSPVYRERTRVINSKLAERYAKHPALSLWHISNEYGGECHCELCYDAFRAWLQNRYGTLDALNRAWWTGFWSKTYTDFSQVEPQDDYLDAQKLDWRRFVTDQTTDFMRHEIAAVRAFSPDKPVTTNMMGFFPELDYWKLARELDVACWDAYPIFAGSDENMTHVAAATAMVHDFMRSLKRGRPFLLMESTPSATNWWPAAKLKRPGVHRLASLQAIAHGSDSVQYFQWRKNRGSYEKFHGAVVDHAGHERTRVFNDVADVGRILEQLSPNLVGTTVPAEAALIFDWESRWALEGASGPREDKQFHVTCEDHYRALWSMGVMTDVINADEPLDKYKLVIAPMLYMIRPGVADRITAFVRAGGTFVTTYLSGIVNESDLSFLGGWPGPLRQTLGVWAEEIDALHDNESVQVAASAGNDLGLSGTYAGRTFADQIHAEGAQVLATYADGWYAGRAALTMNHVGGGRAYYLTTRIDYRFLREFYGAIVRRDSLSRAIDAELPEGVSATVRTDGARRYVFLLNFTSQSKSLTLPGRFDDLLGGKSLGADITLEPYAVRVLGI